MTRQWRGYAIALVVAVLALVVSVGVAIAMATGGPWHGIDSAQASDSEGWRQGRAAGPMMGPGRGRGGMMGDWDDQDGASVTAAQATTSAQQWAAANRPGASVGEAIEMPMGYLFTVTEDGRGVGTIMVNDDTGRVAWWGSVQPSPTATAS
jgi:hypothetical protein